MASYGFDTTATTVANDLSSHISGKTIIVTGASPKGLGAGFIEAIVPHKPKLIVLAGRTVSKLEETAKNIHAQDQDVATRVLVLNLSSQRQIHEAAKEVNAYPENIDVLVNNAGVMALPYELSEDGIEMQFAANHIGHFLFTNLIMEKILSSASGGRVVNVGSDGYRLSPVRFYDINFDNGKTYDKWHSYGQSKTANLLFAKSLSSKLGKKGLVSLSLHPGAIMGTSLADHGPDFESLVTMDKAQGHEQGWWEGFPFKSVAQGAATHVRAAFDPSLAQHNGCHLSDCNVLPSEEVRSWGRDEVEAEMLWQKSEEMVNRKFRF
ncbi:MAG: hypothetical protein M1828_005550 [Chrysothrix sp. TS-e1954]|nr:MAG: hypothetical protein M1828_005550 [Chrysothrix sp. TS-e1954]